MADYNDYIGGCGYGVSPCANCESEPQSYGIFCSKGCWDEYNGEGDYSEEAE